MISVHNLHMSAVTADHTPGATILSNLSLEISQGEFITLIGTSGAGKSSLIKHLNGLLIPQQGDVLVDGRNTRTTSMAELTQKVSLVTQFPEKQLFCDTVEQEILFGVLHHASWKPSDTKQRAAELVTRLGLDLSILHKHPLTLSSGQQRLISIASLLIMDAPVIVLDEPTAGLDDTYKRNLVEVLHELQQLEGKTVIVVSHSREDILHISNRTLVMEAGSLTVDCTPEAFVVLDHPLAHGPLRDLRILMQSLSQQYPELSCCPSSTDSVNHVIEHLAALFKGHPDTNKPGGSDDS